MMSLYFHQKRRMMTHKELSIYRYHLHVGFDHIASFVSIFEAKKEAPTADGIYTLLDTDHSYRSTWSIIDGEYTN